MSVTVTETTTADPEIRLLIASHLAEMRAGSPPESVHALDLSALADPSVTLWGAWGEQGLLGCGALKELGPGAGEIKSMRTHEAARGQGVGAALLQEIVRTARARGYRSLSLETGAQDSFAPAHRLYARHGFVDCPPFGDYGPDPESRFLTLALV